MSVRKARYAARGGRGTHRAAGNTSLREDFRRCGRSSACIGMGVLDGGMRSRGAAVSDCKRCYAMSSRATVASSPSGCASQRLRLRRFQPNRRITFRAGV